jgi:site-specific recombinase XerD
MEAFIVDRKAQGLAKDTVGFYRLKLQTFAEFCDAQVVSQITEITPTLLRTYMLHLEEKGHNEGGRHACYRAVKTFLFWWEDEMEPEGWKNPIRKVKAPKLAQQAIEPVSIADIQSMLTFRCCVDTWRRPRRISSRRINWGVRWIRRSFNYNLDKTSSLWQDRAPNYYPRR